MIDCNGRGVCIDDHCECSLRPEHDEIISGRYCECDNFSCPRQHGQLCAGSDRGTCSCGICQCERGWTGDTCDCPASNETCIRSDNGEVCSGRGVCECGACRCDVSAKGRFLGIFCEECPICARRCDELKSCVQCQMYNTGPLNVTEGMCARNCTGIVVTEVDMITVDEELGEHSCVFYDDDDCVIGFVFSESDASKVRAYRTRACPSEPLTWIDHLIFVLIMIVTPVVVLAILVILAIKLCRKFKK